MERNQMTRLVIGVGFRESASAQSIGEVLARVAAHAAMPGPACAIAVPEDKAAHSGLRLAALATRLPIETVAAGAMREADRHAATRSAQAARHRGVGSVCEAAALAAAGAGAQLIVGRMVSADRHATAAAAITGETSP
jgi:cobalt-precorrin 5A hydrolase